MALATTGERPEEMGMSDTAACLIPILVLGRIVAYMETKLVGQETVLAALGQPLMSCPVRSAIVEAYLEALAQTTAATS